MGPGRGRCRWCAGSSPRRPRRRRSTGRRGPACPGTASPPRRGSVPTRSRSSITTGASPTPSSTRLAHRAAHVLRGRGVGPDARGSASRSANRPEWFVAALGAARLGAQCVPIPSGATAEERDVLLHRRRGRVPPRRGGAPRVPRRARRRAGAPVPGRRAGLRAAARRTRRARPAGRRRCCDRRSTSPPTSTASCATTTSYGLDAPDEVNVTGSPAPPPRRLQRSAQRAAARTHHGAARPLRRVGVVRRRDPLRRAPIRGPRRCTCTG